MSSIENKVVVTTGASSGLGETTARRLSALTCLASFASEVLTDAPRSSGCIRFASRPCPLSGPRVSMPCVGNDHHIRKSL